eukprot:scaffold149_cov315-Pinguiococcus_pyrenoidosus.AAC.131
MATFSPAFNLFIPKKATDERRQGHVFYSIRAHQPATSHILCRDTNVWKRPVRRQWESAAAFLQVEKAAQGRRFPRALDWRVRARTLAFLALLLFLRHRCADRRTALARNFKHKLRGKRGAGKVQRWISASSPKMSMMWYLDMVPLYQESIPRYLL